MTDRAVTEGVECLTFTLDRETGVIGALADSPHEVINLPHEQVEPPHRPDVRSDTSFVQGMSTRDEGLRFLLDIDRMFTNTGLAASSECVGSREAAD